MRIAVTYGGDVNGLYAEGESGKVWMTPRGNFLAWLRGGDVAWMPVCVHIANANNLPGFVPEDLLRQPLDRLRISQFVGGDILYEVRGVTRRLPEGYGLSTESDGDCRKTCLETPFGTLEEEMLFSSVDSPRYAALPPGHVIPGPVTTSVRTRHFVETAADYRVVRTFHEAMRFDPVANMVSQALERVGDEGMVILGGGPSSPLYALTAVYAGLERVVYDLADTPKEVEHTMAVMQQAACRWYEAAAATPCDAVRCTEDLDTKLVSPGMFGRYALPALRQYAEICHAHGKPFVVHMCGHVRDFLELLRDAGVDAVHCLTPPPMGNTPVSVARRVLAGETRALIRLDAGVLLSGSEAELDRHVDELLREADGWSGAALIMPCGRASPDRIRRVIRRVHQ